MNSIHSGARRAASPTRSTFSDGASFLTSLFVSGLLAVGSLPAHAQQTALNTPAMNGSATLSHFDEATNTQCDYVLGRNLKGPYLLTWKGIRPGSEEVVSDGLILKRDTDYTLDVKAGQIAFSSPISPKTIIRVNYRCDTVDSVPNKNTFVLPFQWDLWQEGKSKLTFRTQFRPDGSTVDPKNGVSPLLSALQFVGGTRLMANSELNSGLFVDLHGGDWLGRSGIRLAEKTHQKWGDFGLTYSRAGAQFAQTDVSGLAAGREIREATGALTPMTGLRLGLLLRQTTLLPDTIKDPTAKETTTQETGGTLAFAFPKNSGKIEAGRTQTDTSTPDNNGAKKTQDSLTVTHTLARGASATVGFEAQAIVPTSPSGQEVKEQSTYTQITHVDITGKPTPQLSVTGTFRNELSNTGPRDTEGLKIEATPSPI